jgi:hypothetical protein
MSYEHIKDLRPADFKRYCGVEPETFRRMVELVSKRLTKERRKTGRPPKLSVEDQVLLTLEYWREYRTIFHLATSWGLHESNVCRVIRRVEDILTKSRAFKLPGKKKLQLADHEIEFVVVDVAETPVERPKKAKVLLQRQEEAAHAEEPSGHQRADATSHLHGVRARPRS